MRKINKIEFQTIESKLNNLNTTIDRCTSSLQKMDSLVRENINSGKGIWDGESASQYKNDWENISEEIPKIIELITTQASNLETLLKSEICEE